MLQNGPNEEIGNYSVRSGGRSVDDMESLERDEMKKVNHEVDTKIQNKEGNGEDHENKRERLAEKEDASNNNLGNTYSANSVKKATTGSYCKKCEVNFNSKKNFRRHLIESHETDAYGKCDVTLGIWTDSNVHKLHKDENDDDLKITKTTNMPVITADSVVTDDPIDELVDTGDNDRPVSKIKLDSEVYNKGTAGDPVDETTTITDDSEKESVTLNSVSQGKAARKSTL